MKTKDKLLPYPVLGNYDAVYPMLTDDAVVMPVPWNRTIISSILS